MNPLLVTLAAFVFALERFAHVLRFSVDPRMINQVLFAMARAEQHPPADRWIGLRQACKVARHGYPVMVGAALDAVDETQTTPLERAMALRRGFHDGYVIEVTAMLTGAWRLHIVEMVVVLLVGWQVWEQAWPDLWTSMVLVATAVLVAGTRWLVQRVTLRSLRDFDEVAPSLLDTIEAAVGP